MFGVCDGHGQYGRNVSNFVKVALVQEIEQNYSGECDIDQMMSDSFLKVNKDVEANVPNCTFSGTTCCIVLIRGPQIICANAGDSRAIAVSLDGKARALSRDHKPELPEEHERITAAGGRVQPIINDGEEAGPQRVWLKDQDYPGLAMSRSLGDYVAQSVGVSPDPEVSYYDVTMNDRFFVIASDGVWEFLSNERIAEIAMPFYLKGQAE